MRFFDNHVPTVIAALVDKVQTKGSKTYIPPAFYERNGAFVQVRGINGYFQKFGQKLYSVRNHEKTIRFSLKSRLSERFHWPEMFQIKAEISLRTNVKLIFHKNVGWQGYQWIP